jgi:hypothetical protein
VEDASFSGQIVSIWSKEPARGGVLENVSIRRLGQREFLVGRLADDGKQQDPRIGATFWFPVDEVVMLTEYANVQDARAAFAAKEKERVSDGPKKSGWRFWS